MWAAIIPAVASLAGAAMNYFGGQSANSANAAMAQGQMAFQAAQGEHQEAFAREMFNRQAGFATGAADTAWNRSLQGWQLSNDWNAQQRDISMAFGREMTARQEQFQREMAQQAMDFSLHSSSTAFQRGMADMKAAGLNPLLAYNRGGASAPTGVAPSGATASVGIPSSGAPGAAAASTPGAGSRSAMGGAMATMHNIMGPAIQSALQGARIVGEVENLAATNANTKEQTELLGAQRRQTDANTALTMASTISEAERPSQIRADTQRILRTLGLLGAQEFSTLATGRQTEQGTELIRRFGRPGADPGSLASQIEAIGRPGGGGSSIGHVVQERVGSAGRAWMEGTPYGQAIQRLMELFR